MQEDINAKLRKVFSRNRTEEIGKDVWSHFVIPPFYTELDLWCATKPRVIIGGRGCGKTMILRSFSHNTIFSSNRKNISTDDLKHIGLYWRTDTQFCNMMNNRGIDQDVWLSAFSHLIALSLAKEILESLKSISKSELNILNENELHEINFSKLASISKDVPSTFLELDKYLTSELWNFESWINNVRTIEAPFFLSTKFPIHLIEVLKEEVIALKESVYFVYIDEFENLLDYQQKLINDLVKHSQNPLIYNYAMKRHANVNRHTSGNEQISDIHDFLTVDLEQFLLKNNGDEFKVFASEILLSELNSSDVSKSKFDIDENILRVPEKIKSRLTPEYQKKILSIVENIFPSISQAELAKYVFEDKKLSKKLKEQIGDKLDSHFLLDDFFLTDFPEATVIIPALLSRKKLSADMILSELKKLQEGKDNKFYGDTAWVHNNFIACFLWLHHVALKKTCVFYTGFDTFCTLSHGNIRHLFELCYKSLLFSKEESWVDEISINAEEQSYGALQASEALREEIKSFGAHSLKLYQFVNRLGYLFSLDQKKEAQSENERSHFAITSEGTKPLSNETKKLLIEAEKWSVLYREKSTKKKSYDSPEYDEYVLNPIYAPYFLISYRKKRRIEFKAEEVEVLFNGTLDEYKKDLITKFSARLSDEAKETMLPLFASANIMEE